jgi:hypothetical protein
MVSPRTYGADGAPFAVMINGFACPGRFTVTLSKNGLGEDQETGMTSKKSNARAHDVFA